MVGQKMPINELLISLELQVNPVNLGGIGSSFRSFSGRSNDGARWDPSGIGNEREADRKSYGSEEKNILEASLRCSEQLKLVSQQRRNRRLQVGQVRQTEEEKD